MVAEVDIVLRWIHLAAGITWIGLLYFFNFVNVPFQKELAADLKPKVNPKLLGRSLWWFRHSAWVTVVVGVGLIYDLYWAVGRFDRMDDGAKTILAGGILGIIMMLNVWGVIWPNQKKLLGAMEIGEKPDPNWAKRALMASRVNVTLSFPMLFFMASATHYPLDWTYIALLTVALGALAFALLWFVQMRPAPAAPAPPAPTTPPPMMPR